MILCWSHLYSAEKKQLWEGWIYSGSSFEDLVRQSARLEEEYFLAMVAGTGGCSLTSQQNGKQKAWTEHEMGS